mmetsp:Transcript_45222/g.88465  ORF Transcript_45222/g.88465 Transcript_45222/m.88465 type:complete len:102 (-) Transcript_45222:520-825(-)
MAGGNETKQLNFLDMEDYVTSYKELDLSDLTFQFSRASGILKIKKENYLQMEDTEISYRKLDIADSIFRLAHYKQEEENIKRRYSRGFSSFFVDKHIENSK